MSCVDTATSEWRKAGDCRTMKTFGFILALALCISAYQRNFNAEFEAFEEKYNKNYATATERFVRFLNFQQNLKEIEAFNNEDHSWKKSINKFSDLSETEFKATLNGYINTHKPNGKAAAKKSVDIKVQLQYYLPYFLKKNNSKSNQKFS